MKRPSLRSALLLTVALAGTAVGLRAQAFCSIRDPNRVAREIFPEHTGFRTEILQITAANAQKLPADLPFSFDRREVASHPLQIVTKGDKIIGYLQARTQPTRWGLTEFIWALDAEFRLLDFRVQRSREPAAGKLEASALRARLRGLSLEQIRRAWNPAWLGEMHGATGLRPEDASLTEAAIAAGAKTIWLTKEIWLLPQR